MKLVFVWKSLEAKKQGIQNKNMVWVRKEECPVCGAAGVWFDNCLDVNKCDVCGAVEVTGGWCAPRGFLLNLLLSLGRRRRRLPPRVAIR